MSEIIELLKIPDEILLKLKDKAIAMKDQEIGKFTSYVQELENDIKQLKSLSKEEMKELKKDLHIKNLEENNLKQRQEINVLKKDIEKLIIKVARLQKLKK